MPGTLVNRPVPSGGTEHQNAGFWQAGECGLDHTGCPQAVTAYPHLCEVGRGGVGGQAPSAALQGVPEPKVRPPVTSEPPASPTSFAYIQHSQWFNSSVPTGRVWGALGQAQTPVCAHPAPMRCSFMPSASGGLILSAFPTGTRLMGGPTPWPCGDSLPCPQDDTLHIKELFPEADGDGAGTGAGFRPCLCHPSPVASCPSSVDESEASSPEEEVGDES